MPIQSYRPQRPPNQRPVPTDPWVERYLRTVERPQSPLPWQKMDISYPYSPAFDWMGPQQEALPMMLKGRELPFNSPTMSSVSYEPTSARGDPKPTSVAPSSYSSPTYGGKYEDFLDRSMKYGNPSRTKPDDINDFLKTLPKDKQAAVKAAFDKEVASGRSPQEVLDEMRKILAESTTGGSTTGGSTGGGFDWGYLTPWVQAFQKKHEGVDPITFYGGGEGGWREPMSALREAEWDRAWGDQFMRTYGRPPSDDDWAHSYHHRNQMKWSGANPGGG